MATSRVGPDSAHDHPTVEQADWPRGIVALPRHESRVFSMWVNGSEDFYFKATPAEMRELVRLFSRARMRDHEVILVSGRPRATTFKDEAIAYNVSLHIDAGIALGYRRSQDETRTFEPTLTIHLDPDADAGWLKEFSLPDNIILRNEVPGLGLTSPEARPVRHARHVIVLFENGQRAADFSHGVGTHVTYWERGEAVGIQLGKVDHRGRFGGPFSEGELALLRSGAAWLTLTVGNWSTTGKADDRRLDVANLVPVEEKPQTIRVANPVYYHGRVLFAGSDSAELDPSPWPGATITVNFPFTSGVDVAVDGWFRVFLTADQIEQLKMRRPSRNIYVPIYGERNRRSGLHFFPVDKLSTNRLDAGVVRIPRPLPSGTPNAGARPTSSISRKGTHP